MCILLRIASQMLRAGPHCEQQVIGHECAVIAAVEGGEELIQVACQTDGRGATARHWTAAHTAAATAQQTNATRAPVRIVHVGEKIVAKQRIVKQRVEHHTHVATAEIETEVQRGR